MFGYKTWGGGILLLLCTCWNVLAYCKELNTWTKFWWWNTGTKWPTAVKDVFEKAYGECTTSDYCFQRLPEWTKENKTEILAVDTVGTIYRWKFDSSNPTAHAVWLAFHDHQETPANKITNSKPWNPDTIEGTKPKSNQDSFMYRVQNGVKSVLLDDDNCDCLSSLSFGHGLCGTGHDTRFGKAGEFGADLLYDPNCNGPRSSNGLSLYFRQQKQIHLSEYGGHWTAFWWWTPGATWPTIESDVLQHAYGACTQYDYYCFQRLPSWAAISFPEHARSRVSGGHSSGETE